MSQIAQTIAQLRLERTQKWEETKAFLDSRQNPSGMVSPEDAVIYDRKEAEVVDLGRQIERLERQKNIEDAVSAPTSKPLVSAPGLQNRSGTGE